MKTNEQFVKELHEINSDVAVIGTYTKAVEPVLVKCLVCGKEWTPKAYSLLQGKQSQGVFRYSSENEKTCLNLYKTLWFLFRSVIIG